jgi:hypothetical protein
VFGEELTATTVAVQQAKEQIEAFDKAKQG